MKITLNPDKEVVKTIKEGLERTGGYGPCRLSRSEDYKCMCKEFLNEDYLGECHCGLYIKEEI